MSRLPTVLRILSFVLCLLMLAPFAVGCGGSGTPDESGDSGRFETTSQTDRTIETNGALTPPDPGSPVEGKVYKAPKTVLDPTFPDDGKIHVKYLSSNTSAGKISGTADQTLNESRTQTTSVTAKANLGYKFIGWSDGFEESTRSGDAPDESTFYFALFAYDTLEMPVFHIETDTGRDVESKTEYITGSLSLFNTNSKYEFGSESFKIRGRGNNTWTYEKKSYKFKLDVKQNLLGIGSGKHKTWVLLANMCDQSLLRNYVAMQLGRAMKGMLWMPNSTPCEVYLNGEYRGVYLLAEEIEADDDRVPISENAEAGEDIGFLFEMSVYSDSSKQGYIVAASKQFEIKSDLSANKDLANKQKQFLVNYINQCWNAIKRGDEAGVRAVIDVESAVDAYIAEEILKNLDMGWDSFYFSKDAGGKMTFGPIWDFDLTLGNGNESCQYIEGLYCAIYRRGDDGNTNLSNSWFYALMTCPWFREAVADRWAQLKEDLFDKLDDLVKETAETYYKAFCRNFDKWKIFGKRMNRETELITSLRTYKAHYEYLANWVQRRVDWLDQTYASKAFENGSFINYEGLISGWESNGIPAAVSEGVQTVISKKTNLTPFVESYQTTVAGKNDEGIECAYDGNTATKYCADVSSGEVTLRVFFQKEVTLESVIITTGNDTKKYPERNPSGLWVIYGTNDTNVGNREWVKIGTVRPGDCIGIEDLTKYDVPTGLTEPYRYYKIVISHTALVQFSELEFYGK